MQSQIKKSTGEYLSVQTLNRLFGLIKNDFHTSTVTLDIIAQYLNYDSFSDFVKMYHQPTKTLALDEQAADLLTIMFKDIDPVRGNEECLYKVFLNIYNVIDRVENLDHVIYARMARTALGRKYFFENCVYLDRLNGHYGKGIDFYILHADKREEFLFAHSILCLQSFLNSNYTEFALHFEKIRNYPVNEIQTFSSAVIARYGAALIFNEIFNSSFYIVTEKSGAIIKLIAERDHADFKTRYGRIILAEALLMGEAYNDVLQILYKIKNKFCACLNDAEEMLFLNQENLLRLYANYGTGNIHMPGMPEKIKAINSKPFHFLLNEFYSMLLNQLILLTGNNKEAKTAKSNLLQLVHKTGFVFFNEPVQEGLEV
ncbi:MAG: hypothetical protein IPL84_00725 [Chitinophagaceae bacterium]|nr:hypothetical protein [Chitinophagaceae bacterium]